MSIRRPTAGQRSYLLLAIVTIAVQQTASAMPNMPASFVQSKRAAVFQPATSQGLYDATDDVVVVTAKTFESIVFGQEYGTLLEFYNAFCGFCQKYAPHWKQFATDVHAWRGVVQVAALDCSDDQNSALCRDYEVMGYPTLRYFGPRFVGGGRTANYGQSVNKSDDVAVLRRSLATMVRNTSSEARAPHWPQLLDGSVERPLQQLFEAEPRLDDRVQLAFVLYEAPDSFVATELALDFYANRHVHVHRVHTPETAITYGLHRAPALAAINGQLEVVTLPLQQKTFANRTELRDTIRQYLGDRGLALRTSSTTEATIEGQPNDDEYTRDVQTALTLDYVKKHQPTVYWADLEKALWYALEHEIPQVHLIEKERMAALRLFVTVLARFSPLRTNNGAFFLQNLAYVLKTHPDVLPGDELQDAIQHHKNVWDIPATTGPSAQPWVGCLGTTPNRRGFTCGLWTLFHFLTVQANRQDPVPQMPMARIRVVAQFYDGVVDEVMPADVLRAIHGYVRYFFGCTFCSAHFQEMAAERHMFNVTDGDEAVLWLWRAHNEVNERLAGDLTEDPAFPKHQWPDRCQRCREDHNRSDGKATTADWNEIRVLEYLRETYVAANFSHYGLADETTPPVAASSPASDYALPAQPLVAERRMLDGVFSDGDMRLGILLYMFCIGMLVVAVKMFMRRRGYRKKFYAHDFMGKV